MKFLFAFVMLVLSMAPVAQAATLKIATLAPDGTNWMKLMREAADEVKTRTDSRVKIKYFPGGVQGSDSTVLRKMQIRQLQGGAVSSGALVKISDVSQLYSLPFTFRNDQEISAIREEYDQYLRDDLYNKGYVLLGLANGGFAYIMSAKPITSIESFRQQKTWVPEGDLVSQTTFEHAGIAPISLPISDVYTSLQTGLIDTIGANLSSAIALQWHSKVNYVTDFPLLYLMGMLVVDKGAFEKLSTEDQAIVRDVMAATFKKMDAQNGKDEIGAREALQNAGMEFVSLSEEEKQAWRELADKTLADLAAQGTYPVELYKKLQARLTEIRAGQ